MIVRLRSHLTYANVGVTAALVLAATGVGIAAIPGSDGKIKGCYKSKTGSLRVVDARKSCHRGEKKLTWNQRGPRGATGLAGASGAPGQPGQDGQDGQQGLTGPAGSALAYTFTNTSDMLNNTDTVDDTRSKGITDADVTHPVAGIWCVYNITVKNAVASPTISNGVIAVQGINGDAGFCPGDEALQLSQTVAGSANNTALLVLIN